MFGKRNMAARKLDSKKVEEIRCAYDEGETQGSIARRYGMSAVQIGRIVRGESWNASAKVHAQRTAPLPNTERHEEEVLDNLLNLQVATDALQAPPPSPLDGGDILDETGGEGLKSVMEKAREFGLGHKK